MYQRFNERINKKQLNEKTLTLIEYSEKDKVDFQIKTYIEHSTFLIDIYL